MMVEEPDRVPAGSTTLVGLAATVKSTTLTVTVADRDGNPVAEPVIVTTYVPADGKLTVSVAVPEVMLVDRLMVVGETVPALVLRVTVPVKPLRPVTVMVEVTWAFGATLLTVVGLAVTVKSTTWTLTVVV